MYFRNGWEGKWFPQNETFEKSGLRPIERETLINYCKWVEDAFPNGCDEIMESYMKNVPSITKGENDRYYAFIAMDKDSFAEVEYNTSFGNDDYIIRIYLYRKNSQTATG